MVPVGPGCQVHGRQSLEARVQSSLNQRLDPVDDPLRGFAKLLDGAVCRVSLGHIVGPGMVDQPLRKGREEHQFTLGTGDEAIAKPVEPELRSARLTDAAVEVMHVLNMASGTEPQFAGRLAFARDARRMREVESTIWAGFRPLSGRVRCCAIALPPRPTSSSSSRT